MRLYEIIEPIAPIGAASSTADQAIAQAGAEQSAATQAKQKSTTPIIDFIRSTAGNQPVKPTGNTGIDNLLFKEAALSKGAGGLSNLIGKGLNAVGGAFAAQTSIQRAKFDRPMRSGAQMRAGVSAQPNAPVKTLSTGQQQTQGLDKNISAPQASREQVIARLTSVATPNQPVNATGNPGIDDLLTRAGLLKSGEENAA